MFRYCHQVDTVCEQIMNDIWHALFELAPIKRPTPPSTLYDVIVDTKDLATVKRYVAGGHAIDQQFAGGQSVTLAVSNGDLEFVRYFVEAATDLQGVHELVTHAARRFAESSEDQLAEARDILDYILDQSLSDSQLTKGLPTIIAKASIPSMLPASALLRP